MSQTILSWNEAPCDRLRAVTSRPVAATESSRSAPGAVSDAELIAVLDAPLAPGETALAGYARKERDLGGLFAQLAVMEARAMHARLSSGRAGDELATKFARLVTDRRARLLAFLADARRRAAIAGAR